MWGGPLYASGGACLNVLGAVRHLQANHCLDLPAAMKSAPRGVLGRLAVPRRRHSP